MQKKTGDYGGLCGCEYDQQDVKQQCQTWLIASFHLYRENLKKLY